jgi:hypothetical protein
VNGTYNIVVNNVLFVDPSHSMRVFKTQLSWLEDRLRYAQDHQAKQVYGELRLLKPLNYMSSLFA